MEKYETKKIRCCYYNSVENFLKEDEENWLKTMCNSFNSLYHLPLEEPQEKAWRDCFNVLQNELPFVNNKYPGLQIIFEYALPYESGRRPDVILLSEECVIVLEFKQYDYVLPADIDQVKSYVRDLREYHYESRNKKVVPVLLLTGTEEKKPQRYHGIILCSKNWIDELCSKIFSDKITPTDAKKWIDSKYEPLPTIVEAARTFMKNEALPNIRKVNSTVIPQAIECLKEITKDARENKKHILALVTGVPGAGKTYLGLQYVYEICESNEHANSIYLSGNGSLVKLLQSTLENKTFVKNVHSIIKEYTSNILNSFEHNIIVFDEGQRAWDMNQMGKKNKIEKSEADIMVEICDKKLEWCVLLILVGEGQEIYNGENAGLEQWNTAVKKAKNNWEIVCPDKLEKEFSLTVQKYPELDLNTSLRTHTAGEVSKFVNEFIAGNIEQASSKAIDIINNGFNMYYTRNLENAKNYCRKRYSGYNNKRYCLLASSKNKELKNYGLRSEFELDIVTWFNGEIGDKNFSNSLELVISEFNCQGLEVDMPIIVWGKDLKWYNSAWLPEGKNDSDKAYRLNSYRVLLTRGRDGFIVFIPPIAEMDIIENLFKNIGVKKLEEALSYY